MATYATYGGIPMFKPPYIPIVKVKDLDIHVDIDSIYVAGTNQGSDPAERQTLFMKLQTWLWGFPVTWPKLKAANIELVSNADLTFILDLCQNLNKYYSDTSRLYSHKTKQEAFLLETINYIILGNDPEKARGLALTSLKNEKFISGESWLVTITNMPQQVKTQYQQTGNSVIDEGNTQIFPQQTDNIEKPKTKSSWLLIGGLVYLITRRK